MSAPIQNQNPMVALTSTEHSRRHREREKIRKNQPDHASTAEAHAAQQQRSILLTATKRQHLKRELKRQNQSDDVKSKNWSVPMSRIERKRHERVPRRDVDVTFTRNKKKQLGHIYS
jgi:hypothetical protein